MEGHLVLKVRWFVPYWQHSLHYSLSGGSNIHHRRCGGIKVIAWILFFFRIWKYEMTIVKFQLSVLYGLASANDILKELLHICAK